MSKQIQSFFPAQTIDLSHDKVLLPHAADPILPPRLVHVLSGVLGVRVQTQSPEDDVEHGDDAHEEDEAELVEAAGVGHVIVVVPHPLLAGFVRVGAGLGERGQRGLLLLAPFVVVAGTANLTNACGKRNEMKEPIKKSNLLN